MDNGIRVGLTFDDVLLVPKKSTIETRKAANTRTKLSKHLELNIPIISANMDTVTESAMAITMARQGGIGIIHRFLSVSEQVAEVSKVKRSEGILIEQPMTITPDRTVREASQLMQQYGIGGLLVVNNGKLVGILTSRDLRFEENLDVAVEKAMTKDLVTAPVGTTIEDAKRTLKQHKIEKLPIVDKEMRVRGLITGKDIIKRQQFPQASKDSKGRLRVGAAIGVKGDYMERAAALIEAGADVLVVDIAHGHSDLSIRAVAHIRDKFGPVELIAGNVATAQGTKDLIEAGVDAVKVGVGAGSICVTRIVTGAGVPQLTAVMDCTEVANAKGIPVIADGGIRTSGDLTKAIAAGASTVMIGSLLAGTDEAPGVIISRHSGRFKMSRGMASLGAAMGRSAREKGREMEEQDLLNYVPEGVEGLVPYRGAAIEVLSNLIGGLRSGMSYCGATNIKELQQNAEFIRVTEAGYKESQPHDIQQL
ncbi:MAG: IMP dehydrogenase [Thaumarchaeota archaeon]|nr:IMP dehydrogenase [Nitrososphaerota archaeon]